MEQPYSDQFKFNTCLEQVILPKNSFSTDSHLQIGQMCRQYSFTTEC